VVVRLWSSAGALQILDRNTRISLGSDGGGQFYSPGSIDPAHFEPAEGPARHNVWWFGAWVSLIASGIGSRTSITASQAEGLCRRLLQ
jgi:hypothetical protein